MLIAGYIKKDFIQETLKQNTTEDLRAFLSIFKSIPYVILLKDFDCDFSKILKDISEDECIGSREIEWRNLIKELISENRLFEKVDENIFESSKFSVQKNNLRKKIHYFVRALTGKTYSFSFIEDKEFKFFGNTITQFQTNLFKTRENNEDEINLRVKDYKAKLYFEKLAGFTCFYDTVFVFDQYIIEPCLDAEGKCTKRGFINMCKLLAKAPKVKNIIICTQDWWKRCKPGTYLDNGNQIFPKKDVINSFINEIKSIFESNNKKIAINLFLLPPSIFINEHERFFAYTQLYEHDNNIDLKDLKDNYFLPLELGQGLDYFKEDPIISAKVKYSSTSNFKKVFKRFSCTNAFQCKETRFKKEFKQYWLKEYGKNSDLYVHHNEIINYQNFFTNQ